MDENQPAIDEQILKIYGKLRDAPTDCDLLKNFDPTAKALAQYIKETIETNHDSNGPGHTHGGYTIGAYGEWGSGKTSFLKMVEKYIEEKGIRPIWFEAWKYDKEDNLWAALLQTILNQASTQSTWYRRVWVKLRIWWKNLRFREGSWGVLKQLLLFVLRLLIITASIYALFSVYAVITGNPLTTVFQKDQLPANLNSTWTAVLAVFIIALAADPFKWADFLKGAVNIDFSKFESKAKFVEHIAFVDEFTQEFQQIIQLLHPKELVVIIDDLDRCSPDKAVQVLEAIKVFLDFDKCVFLLALDRKMVERYIAPQST